MDKRLKIFIWVWIVYASFYFMRVNISVAIPGIIRDFGFTKTQIGIVLTSLFTCYAVGQFVNGQFSDRFNPRKLIAIGLIGSAMMNIIFGFLPGIISAMMLIWGINGYLQSMGWSSVVKITDSLFEEKKKGKFSGILGTSYQIGNALSWALAGFVVGLLGWRWAFWIPAVICLFIAIKWLFITKDLHTVSTLSKIKKTFNIRKVLTSPYIWLAALSLLFLNIIRYGFMDWAPTYMFEVQKATISMAAYKAILFPALGCIGALFAGYACDKYMKNKKALVSAIMLVILGFLCLLYPHTIIWWQSLLLLMAIGFFTFGPHVLIVTALPMELNKECETGSITGFIDGMGYVGASLTGVLTGFLIDNFNWNYAFYFWVCGAFLAAIMMFILWRRGY